MSATAPSGGGPRQVQLGELLVQRGVLSQEQLAAALAEQRETGRPLGEVIVRRGLVPGPIVAQALATQHGGMVKTEYGFATGWTDGAAAPTSAPTAAAVDPRDETIRQLREWATKAQSAIGARDTEIERLRGLARPADTSELDAARAEVARLEGELAKPAVEDPRVAELESTVAGLRAELAKPAVEDPRVAELERTVAELRAELAKPAVEDPRVAELTATVAADRESLAAAERKLANASSRASTLAARLAEQEQEIAELRAALDATPASRWVQAESHLVFVRGSDGYELVERSGPPPAVGATVDGGVVARVGAGPWPGLELPCAYLVD